MLVTPPSLEFSEGDMTSDCLSEFLPCTNERSSLVLTMNESESLFGSQMSWSKINDDHVLLAVASERSSLGARFSGAVNIYEVCSNNSGCELSKA